MIITGGAARWVCCSQDGQKVYLNFACAVYSVKTLPNVFRWITVNLDVVKLEGYRAAAGIRTGNALLSAGTIFSGNGLQSVHGGGKSYEHICYRHSD